MQIFYSSYLAPNEQGGTYGICNKANDEKPRCVLGRVRLLKTGREYSKKRNYEMTRTYQRLQRGLGAYYDGFTVCENRCSTGLQSIRSYL